MNLIPLLPLDTTLLGLIMDHSETLRLLRAGDVSTLARTLTWVENELPGSKELLEQLEPRENTAVIGFTGPPGAGKSTLINALIGHWTSSGKRIAVLAVDPTSPFNYGSLLGDRLRMAEHFNHPGVFIRSVATRGSLGGLSEKVIEMVDVMRCADFDIILVETVGVGQSEVEIAGLADTTVVVVVPEAGDEIQTLKSGIMEIADVFIVNKSDRDGADALVRALRQLTVDPRPDGWTIPVLKTSAARQQGIEEVSQSLADHVASKAINRKKMQLLAEKAFRLIQQKRMRDVTKTDLVSALEKAQERGDFNLYRFVSKY